MPWLPCNPARRDWEGRIRLGLTYISSGYFIFPILARFRRAYPKLEIEVVEDDRGTMEQRLKAGDVDLALVLTSNLTDRDRIASTTFLKSKRRLWLSSAHPLLSNERITFEDIAGEPYVLLRADEADASAGKYWARRRRDPNCCLPHRPLGSRAQHGRQRLCGYHFERRGLPAPGRLTAAGSRPATSTPRSRPWTWSRPGNAGAP